MPNVALLDILTTYFFLKSLQSAIGSAAAAAESAFVPYAEKVLELMKMYMTMTKDEELTLRARATELVGIIGVAIGKPIIQPVLPSFIEAALSVGDSSLFMLVSVCHVSGDLNCLHNLFVF